MEFLTVIMEVAAVLHLLYAKRLLQASTFTEQLASLDMGGPSGYS